MENLTNVYLSSLKHVKCRLNRGWRLVRNHSRLFHKVCYYNEIRYVLDEHIRAGKFPYASTSELNAPLSKFKHLCFVNLDALIALLFYNLFARKQPSGYTLRSVRYIIRTR